MPSVLQCSSRLISSSQRCARHRDNEKSSRYPECEDESQKMRLSKPRRMLSRATRHAVQCRSHVAAERLDDRACPNKVSMKKGKRKERKRGKERERREGAIYVFGRCTRLALAGSLLGSRILIGCICDQVLAEHRFGGFSILLSQLSRAGRGRKFTITSNRDSTVNSSILTTHGSFFPS